MSNADVTSQIKLSEYLSGIEQADTAAELEAAIQAPYNHRFRGPTWSRICNARIKAGNRICAAHPNGRFVPQWGMRRKLYVCGETTTVGRGQNSTGVRYVWHYAGQWAIKVMVDNGLPHRAAHRIWDVWSSYPHRCLKIIEAAMNGEITDPPMHTLIECELQGYEQPVNVHEDDRATRANQPCACGGTRWDWGAGYSEGFNYINWHCDKCPKRFTEYVTAEKLREIRNPSQNK